MEQFSVLYPGSPALLYGFEHLYIVMWLEKNMLLNYNFLNFHRNYALVSVVKLVWNVVGGSEIFESFKFMYFVRQKVVTVVTVHTVKSYGSE